jgi:hypothetical protein
LTIYLTTYLIDYVNIYLTNYLSIACGYFGIRYWIPKLLYIYLFYLSIDLLIAVLTLIIYEMETIYICIEIFHFILSGFMIRIVYKLIFHSLIDFTDADLLWLQNSTIIKELDSHRCSI